MKSFTITRISLVFVMILAYVICTSADGGKFGHKTLIFEGISSNISLDTPFGPLRMKNCGPSLTITVTPYPIQLDGETKLDFNFTAAYTLIDGDLEIKVNQRPYIIQRDICDTTKDTPTPFCPIKKGETYLFTVRENISLYTLYKGHYVVKGAISNSNDEVLLCLSMDMKFP
ncbi:uncharacterized protein [Amphiura filiformis]|uniref:uncharacterized protein n=1 Tax=Amphiura filiformis TaxID=82378 RepID=UPI003B218279